MKIWKIKDGKKHQEKNRDKNYFMLAEEKEKKGRENERENEKW